MSATTAAPMPYLAVYPSMEDGRAFAQCPACSGPLEPTLHLDYYDHRKAEHVGACYKGCSKDWQPILPHLRWFCNRCGWGPDTAVTQPTSHLDPRTGAPSNDVSDIPF